MKMRGPVWIAYGPRPKLKTNGTLVNKADLRVTKVVRFYFNDRPLSFEDAIHNCNTNADEVFLGIIGRFSGRPTLERATEILKMRFIDERIKNILYTNRNWNPEDR